MFKYIIIYYGDHMPAFASGVDEKQFCIIGFSSVF